MHLYAWRDMPYWSLCGADCGTGYEIQYRNCTDDTLTEIEDSTRCGTQLIEQHKRPCDTGIECDSIIFEIFHK